MEHKTILYFIIKFFSEKHQSLYSKIEGKKLQLICKSTQYQLQELEGTKSKPKTHIGPQHGQNEDWVKFVRLGGC